jgi:hypothetical protein
MANQLKIKRGTKASLPTLAAGELGFCTDTYETYVGTGSSNKFIGSPSVIVNPMTTQGDVIYGGASGAPTRLPKGTASQVLTMNSGATAPEWQTPSSGGKVAQIVETATTSEYYTNATIPLDTTIPQNTEGAELMTVSITPTNANSKLVVEVDLPITDIHYYYFIMALFKDSTANALNATFRGETGQAGIPRPMRMTYSMTAGGTSQITFRLRYGGTNASYNVYVNRTYNSSSVFGGIARATLRVTEYLP